MEEEERLVCDKGLNGLHLAFVLLEEPLITDFFQDFLTNSVDKGLLLQGG